MNKLSKRTINLLRLTRESILREPCAYNQSDWGPEDKPTCGSEACIVGWMVYHATKWMTSAKRLRTIRRYRKDAIACGASGVFVSGFTEKLLGLDHAQINKLYWHDNWPSEFSVLTDDDEEMAKNAAKRITHFIKTNGEE